MRLIDADELDTVTITTDDYSGNEVYEVYLEEDVKEAQTINAIPIPKGSTNGDILNTLFPDEKRLFHLFSQCRDWIDAPFERKGSAKGSDNSDDEREERVRERELGNERDLEREERELERELSKKGKSKHYDKEMER